MVPQGMHGSKITVLGVICLLGTLSMSGLALVGLIGSPNSHNGGFNLPLAAIT